MKEIKVSSNFDGEKVIIELPIDVLICAAENQPGTECEIINKQLFGEYVAKEIIEERENSSERLTRIYALLDQIFEDAYESDQCFLKPNEWWNED